MAVFLMVTAHLECKICLSFKASSVILQETFKIELRKKGSLDASGRYSGAAVLIIAFLGFQEMPWSLYLLSLGSGCHGLHGKSPGSSGRAQSSGLKHCSWRCFPGFAVHRLLPLLMQREENNPAHPQQQ